MVERWWFIWWQHSRLQKYIDKVRKVVIDEVEKGENNELDFSQTSLEIWTEEGDKYELILEAVSADNLKLIKKSDDWLTPKVYKGKEEEE
jgi:hypothetical protein